jgi:predicted acylesterase/phospholipase RssA
LIVEIVGLVLSGGGARGLAHLGVIRALEEHNIPIDFICGTSQGAFISALYAKHLVRCYHELSIHFLILACRYLSRNRR